MDNLFADLKELSRDRAMYSLAVSVYHCLEFREKAYFLEHIINQYFKDFDDDIDKEQMIDFFIGKLERIKKHGK